MGTTATSQNFDKGEQKLQQLKKKQINLRKDLQQKQFMKGDALAESYRLIFLTGQESKEQLFKGIAEMFKQHSAPGFNFTFEIIANKLHALLATAKTADMVLQESTNYPLMTKKGFAMVFFNLYLERYPLEKEHPSKKKIAMINAFRIVLLPPPKTRQELRAYIMASAIQSNDQREQIVNAIWANYQSLMSPEEKKKQKEKDLLLKQLRDLEADCH